MQIPILNGIYTDGDSDFRTSYPRNLIPVPKAQGISNGYLRPAEGLVSVGAGPGIDRGGINWNGVLYRVMDTQLISIGSNNAITTIGNIGGTGQVRFDYSFDYLAVMSSGNLWLWNGTLLQQITDPDLGTVNDFLWVDGYFMTTDGTSLVVTELNDPFSVNPLKYGSSEVDPDPIKSLQKIKDEVYAVNRYTTEVFTNVGGTNFPFQRIPGALVQRGTLSAFTCCVYMDGLAFLGSGRNEAPAIWLQASGSSVKISTREIDQILLEYPESTLVTVLLESRVSEGFRHLFIHLPDRTLVYDAAASEVAQEAVWFTLSSGIVGKAQYRARNMVWCYDRWYVGDTQSSTFGYMSDAVGEHWGALVGWEFGTKIVYNEGRGVIFHEIELLAVYGRAALGVDSTVWTQYSLDGLTWSQEKPCKAGLQGDRTKKISWLQQGYTRDWRIQKFRGTSDARLSLIRIEARVEGMTT